LNHPLPRLALLVAGLGGGFLVLVHQALGWFQTDVWRPVSVLSGLQWLHVRWAVVPQGWQGVHEFLGHVPLGLALPVVGLLGALAFSRRR
jgi:hypothetical protein